MLLESPNVTLGRFTLCTLVHIKREQSSENILNDAVLFCRNWKKKKNFAGSSSKESVGLLP